jgi:hypothetical protein
VPLPARSGSGLHSDLNVSTKQGQEVHEPLGGETGKLAAQEAGDFGLVDFKRAGSLSLREPPRANRFADAYRKVCLRETLFGIGKTDVSEYVPAAFLDLNLLPHDC